MKKIIRDKIPEIATKDGGYMNVSVVSKEVGLQYMIEKLDEEVAELKEAMALSVGKPFTNEIRTEMADVFEVMKGIQQKWLQCHGGVAFANETIVNTAKAKASTNGAFDRNYILEVEK